MCLVQRHKNDEDALPLAAKFSTGHERATSQASIKRDAPKFGAHARTAFAVFVPLLTALRSSALSTAMEVLRMPLRHVALQMAARIRASPQMLSANDCNEPVMVGVGGGGVFFFWQMGAARALKEEADRRGVRVVWAGSSAGALCGALALCDVPPRRAVLLAHSMATQEKLYDRATGLAGVWGAVIRAWLEELLPDNAAELCTEALAVHVTLWRGWKDGLGIHRQKRFEDRDRLIDALMASVHIPWFLDGRMWASLQVDSTGKRLIAMDGSLLRFLPVRNLFGVSSDALDVTTEPHRVPDYFISHTEDKYYSTDGPGFTELISVDAALEMVEKGYEFTRDRLRNDGLGNHSAT